MPLIFITFIYFYILLLYINIQLLLSLALFNVFFSLICIIFFINMLLMFCLLCGLFSYLFRKCCLLFFLLNNIVLLLYMSDLHCLFALSSWTYWFIHLFFISCWLQCWFILKLLLLNHSHHLSVPKFLFFVHHFKSSYFSL